jgi:hypothetical protein
VETPFGRISGNIDRVGPCSPRSKNKYKDVRATKRKQIIERAKFILTGMFIPCAESQEIAEEVRQSVRVDEISIWKK